MLLSTLKLKGVRILLEVTYRHSGMIVNSEAANPGVNPVCSKIVMLGTNVNKDEFHVGDEVVLDNDNVKHHILPIQFDDNEFDRDVVKKKLRDEIKTNPNCIHQIYTIKSYALIVESDIVATWVNTNPIKDPVTKSNILIN